jgi:hypothetical protein
MDLGKDVRITVGTVQYVGNHSLKHVLANRHGVVIRNNDARSSRPESYSDNLHIGGTENLDFPIPFYRKRLDMMTGDGDDFLASGTHEQPRIESQRVGAEIARRQGASDLVFNLVFPVIFERARKVRQCDGVFSLCNSD